MTVVKLKEKVDGELTSLCAQLLGYLDTDPSRPDLQKTPERFAKTLRFLTQGNDQSLNEIAQDALFEAPNSDIVLLKNIQFHSLCEHHILPFFGRAHIAYYPSDKIIGLSKIPRIVEMYARRLQVQERLGEQIAAALESVLKPKGVICLLEAEHMCMMMRGVEQHTGSTTTLSVRGEFQESPTAKAEFMSLIQSR